MRGSFWSGVPRYVVSECIISWLVVSRAGVSRLVIVAIVPWAVISPGDGRNLPYCIFYFFSKYRDDGTIQVENYLLLRVDSFYIIVNDTYLPQHEALESE